MNGNLYQIIFERDGNETVVDEAVEGLVNARRFCRSRFSEMQWGLLGTPSGDGKFTWRFTCQDGSSFAYVIRASE